MEVDILYEWSGVSFSFNTPYYPASHNHLLVTLKTLTHMQTHTLRIARKLGKVDRRLADRIARSSGPVRILSYTYDARQGEQTLLVRPVRVGRMQEHAHRVEHAARERHVARHIHVQRVKTFAELY